MVPSLTLPLEQLPSDGEELGFSSDASLTGHERVLPPTTRSRRALLIYAHGRLCDLAERQGRSSVEPHRHVLHLLGSLLVDGSPTPQIGDNGDGGISVEWLVDGRSFRLDYEDESEILLEGRGPAGDLLFSQTVTAWWLSTDQAIIGARDFLKLLARDVHRPLPL